MALNFKTSFYWIEAVSRTSRLKLLTFLPSPKLDLVTIINTLLAAMEPAGIPSSGA